jgi:hypothetical protein
MSVRTTRKTTENPRKIEIVLAPPLPERDGRLEPSVFQGQDLEENGGIP